MHIPTNSYSPLPTVVIIFLSLHNAKIAKKNSINSQYHNILLLIPLDYINEVLNENQEEDNKQPDDWEGGLTFIAKSSRK